MTPIALLDGGLGQEIYRRAADVSSPLWSVAVMQEQPDVVSGVHEDFIRAGARTLTLNTYTATPTRLGRSGVGDQIEHIHKMAFEILERAIDVTGADVDIAACLPPLSASYQDRPDRTPDDLQNEYATLVELQKNADVFLIETMTNTLEATAACAAAQKSGKPFAVSFRLEVNGYLRSGETLGDALAAVADFAPGAVMLNCCDPEIMTVALPQLVARYPRVGGYANAFESVEELARGGSVDALQARPDISPEAYTALVQQWLKSGAQIVGGCCEITPRHIAHLADHIRETYQIVRLSECLSGRVHSNDLAT